MCTTDKKDIQVGCADTLGTGPIPGPGKGGRYLRLSLSLDPLWSHVWWWSRLGMASGKISRLKLKGLGLRVSAPWRSCVSSLAPPTIKLQERAHDNASPAREQCCPFRGQAGPRPPALFFCLGLRWLLNSLRRALPCAAVGMTRNDSRLDESTKRAKMNTNKTKNDRNPEESFKRGNIIHQHGLKRPNSTEELQKGQHNNPGPQTTRARREPQKALKRPISWREHTKGQHNNQQRLKRLRPERARKEQK